MAKPIFENGRTLRQMLSGVVSAAFSACGYDEGLGTVTFSDRADLCQFQCNGALSGAKTYKKNPMLIAADVVARLSTEGMFRSVEAAPPGFINMTLSDEFIASAVAEMSRSERLGLPTAERKKKIVIDYGGPNVAKPLHVGHLRTAIIGEALKRIAKFLGHDVIGDIHIGDWGLQMGLIIAFIEEKNPGLPYFDEEFSGEYPENAPVTLDDLSEIYPAASARSKTDAEFKSHALRATSDLQNGRRGYVALWRQLLALSVEDLRRSYARLLVDFDVWLGESDAAPYVEELLALLEDKGITYMSDGARIADVALPEDDEPVPPIIISKSDGSQLYATTDLATIMQRMRDFSPDEIWYVVDIRQAMHFKQVFRLARRAGLVGEDTGLYHVSLGTMNGKDGKPYKTREGGVMRLSSLIDMAAAAAREKIDASDTVKELSEAERAEIAEKVGIAAIKFGDLINHRTKDYIFDLERFLSSEGKTGPYLQYTVVRISSLLSRAADRGDVPGELLPPASETERALALKLFAVGDALQRAFEEKAPSAVCEVMFDIAGLFNRFYFENKILAHEDSAQRASWLALLSLVRDMLIKLLNLLAADVPPRM